MRPVIPQLARAPSAPFSDDVNVGCFRKHLSRIETHYRVNLSSVKMTKCLLSHLEPKGWSGLSAEVISDPLKALPVGGRTGLDAVLWARFAGTLPVMLCSKGLRVPTHAALPHLDTLACRVLGRYKYLQMA